MARIETRDGRYEDYPESSQTSDNIVNTVNDLIENRGYSASEVREYSKNILKNQPELLNQVLNMVGEEQQGTTQQPQINPLIAGEPEQLQQKEIPALIASNPQELPPTTRIANKVEEALTKKTPVQIGNGTSVPEVALMTKSERIAHKSAEMAAKFKGAPTTLEELRAVNPKVSPQEEAAFLQAQKERDFLSNPNNLGTLPNSDPYTLGEVAGDVTNAVTQGVVEGVGAAYGLANFASENNLYKTTKKAINAVTGAEDETARESSSLDSYTGFSAKLKRASDFWERLLQSDNAKATDEQIKASMDKYGSKVDEQIKERIEEGYPEWVAEAEGLGKKAYNSAKEYAKNPSAIVFEVIQEIPSIVTGGAIGKGATELLVQGVDPKVAKRFFNTKRGKELQEKVATRAGVASAAVSEASSNALETKAEILTKSEKELTATSPIYNDYRAAGLDHEQARMKVSDDGFNVVFGLTLPVGAATSKLTGAGKLEGNLFIPNSNLASAVQKNASAFFKEGVEEAIQGGAGQTIQNLGKRETADETQELTEGVGEAIGQGAVVGAGAGLTITGIATAPQLAAGTLETTAKGGTAFAEVAKEVTKQVKDTVNSKVNEASATNEIINKAVKTGNLDEITNTESENYSGVDALGALVNPKFIPAQDVDNDESDEEYEGRLNEYLEKITTHDANAMRELSEMRDASPEERKAAVNRYKRYQSQAVGLIKAIKSGTVAEAIDNLKNEQSSEEDVDTVLGSMADGIFSTVTEEQAEALATNTNLTDEQKTQVEAFIALKKAQGVLSRGGTTKKVQQEILHGSDGALGLNDYTNLLTKAVRAKDRDSARVALTNLSEFAKTQRTKANAIREAYKTAVATNTTVPVKVGDTTYNIHKGSNNSGFIDAVQEDTQAVISTFTSLKKFAIAGLSGEQQQEQQVAPEQQQTTPTTKPDITENNSDVPVNDAEIFETTATEVDTTSSTETTPTQVDADNSFDSLDLALDSDASREDVEVLLDGVTEDAFKLRKELVGSLDDDSKDSLDKSIKALRRKPKKAETIKKHLDNIRTITGQQTTDAETNTTNTTEPQAEESTSEEEVTKYTNRTTSPSNEWSGIGAQFNVVNDDTDADIENTEVTAEAVAQGEFVADQWGYKNTADEGFLTRVWNQVSNSDAVFAIATGFQQTTSGALRVKGSEGYPVQMAINAGKPAYVFNQETGDWLKYSQEDGFFKVMDEAPTLTPNFAGVAGKNISEGARQAINDVYSKTFPDVDESSRLRNIDPNAFIADTSETVALDETILEGSFTLTDSLEDKEKPEPKVDFMQDTVVDNLASKVFTATAEDNVYAETDDILDELEPYSEDINIPQTTIKFLKNTKDMLFNSVDKIFGLNPENFINNNYLEAFRKEGSNGFRDGLAENIKNAITVATAEWLLDREDSLRELTIADIASLTGLTQDSVQNNNALLSYYKDKGVPLQVVSQEIGRKVVRSLKIKARPSAEHNADDKLARAIGNMVTLSLADLGVLTLGEVKGIYRDGAINPDEVYKYVRLNKNNTKFIKNLQGKQDSIETLSKFLDIKEDTTTFPQFTAPTVKDTVNKAGTKISKRLKAALKKYTARAFRIEPTNFSAFKALGTDTIADIMGYERYPDRVHASRLDGVEMRNRQIMDSIKYLEEFADHLETNGSGLNQQFYYSSEVDVNGRARIIQKRVNPQTDKLARAMTTMEGWEYTVDNQGARNMFKAALAQAFDIKVDKLTLHTSLKQIDAIMRGEGEKGQAYVNGVAALKRLMNNESSSIEDDRRIVAESVAVMGEKAHSLQGLIAATNYSDTQPFKSTLTIEIDGITNGTALGLLQFAPLGKQIRSWLAKVGIFLDHRISFGFARESGDIPHDNYETLAIAMQEEMLKLERVGRAGRDYKINQYMSIANSELRKIRMIGNLLSKSYAHISGRHRSQKAQDKLDLFGVVRDIAKNPVMIGNYGAGNTKIIDEFINELINNIYVSLEDASNNSSADEVALIKQDLEAVLGHDINLSLENALTWELKGQDLAAFTESVEDTFGYAMKQALKKEFGLIQEKRTKFNQMLSAINTVYTTVWNERYKEILDEKGIFTKADAKALRKELADLMPLVSTANSNGAEEELNLLKNQAQGSQNFKDLIQLVYKNKPAGQHTMKFHKTLKAFADTINYQDVGSRPTVFGIQSTDSAIMAENLLADYDSLNIYDAVIVKPTDAILAAETLNEATYRLNREHSMYADGARRLQQVLDKYPKKYEAQVNENLQITFIKDLEYQGLTPDEVIRNAIREADTIFNDRKKLFKSIKYLTQYNMEAGGYYANRTDSESIAKRIEYLVEQIKTTLGSDANAFISPASMQEFDLTNSTVLGLMNNLRASATVGSSLEHANRLDTLMGDTFNTLINPLKLYVGTSAAENQGIFDYTNQEIKVNLKTGARTSGLELGADEVLAHEVVHSIVKEALESNSGYARAIREMWYQARKVITPDDLRSAGDSADVAQKRWDYIFNNPNKIGKYSVGLHEFVAFGLTNEKMINALNNKVSPNTEENNPNNTLWDKLRNLYTKMLRMFSERLKGINAANSSDRLVKLTKHLVEAERKAQQVAYKNTFVDKIEDSIQSGLVEYIQQPLLKLLVNQRDKGITSTSKVRNIVGGFAAAGEIAITGRFKEFKNIIDDVARRFGITEKSLLRSLLNEVQGRTDENNAFYQIARMARKQIDQARAEIAHSIKSHLRRQFVSDLTDDQEVALSKFIIKADLSTLVDSYNPEQIQELITNPVKLAKAIQQTRYELKQGHNTQYNFYRRMARSLGNMMVKGKPTEAHVLLNAKAIAELVGVAGRATPANSAAAEPLIDRLASLEALSILMREDTEAHAQFKSIVDAEFARDPEDNGVLFSLLTHRDYKERAKRDLFAGSELQMQKGYTREIYNPNKSFIVEDESREEELAKDGYVKVGSVPSDPLDPNTSDRAMYVSDMGTLTPWQAGAISTANKNAKGTSYFKTVVDFNDPTMVVAAIAQLQQITDAKEYSAKAIFDNTSKPKEQTALVPVLDPSGKITDYRYMMEEKTKDLLDRNLRITDVLGAMEGNMKSKVSGEDINRQVADALVEDYQDNYLRNPRGYVNISPDTDREDLVELYRLMPHEMREYIRAKTGSSGIYVKEELVKLLFGQRNFSASMWAKEKMQLAEASSQQMNSFMKPVYRLLGAPLTSKIGQGWEELVSLIKDTIVIKSFTTLFGNIVSNNVLLWSLGVPIKDVIVGQENAVRYAEEFQVVHEQIVDIEREIAVEKQKQQTPARRRKILGLEAEKTRLEDSLEVNPLKELMDEGVYQSIIEDVDMLKDEFSYKSRLEEWVSPFTDNVPDGVKTVGSYALLTQDTKVYQILRRSTQLSDLAARYVLHLHNQKKGMSKENSINNVVDTFIDYDLPTHKGIDYLNRKGGIFFTKYFLRIQKIIVNTVKTAPARILGLTLLQELFGNFSDITDSFALFKDIFFMFSNPVKTTGAYFDTHPWLNLLD